MANETNGLAGLSAQLADAVAGAAPSVVRIDDGSRLTATGIIWSADGLILTTSHGVETDENVMVEMHDGARLPASIVGRDGDSDLALLRVAASNLPAFSLADGAGVKVGHLALALGRPGAAGLQATLGIVSARFEAQSEGRPEFLVHTDATLFPGFSGGPLLNVCGELVGLLNLTMGRGQGVALGVPILSHVAETLLASGTVKRGYLGVSTQSVPLSGALASSQSRGLLVVQIAPDSPAESSGLLLGDILLSVDGQTTEDADGLRKRLRARAAGQATTLTLLRGGQPQTVSVTLGAWE